jgi:GNAT superfamily N-acetyltransferase
VRITEATDDDLRAVRAWFNPGQDERPERRAPGVTDFVAKHGNRLVGFIQLVRRSEDFGVHGGFWLYSLRVRLTYRGMGLGEMLMQTGIERARQDGAREVSGIVLERNLPSMAMCRKLGFVVRTVPELDAQSAQGGQTLGGRRMLLTKLL